MRFGVMAPFYPVPGEGTEKMHALLDECERHGFSVLDRPPLPEDASSISAIRARAAELDVEIEMPARGVFQLADSATRAAGEAALRGSIESARGFGARVIRTGYGRLTMETSRFASGRTPADHLAWYLANLEEAAAIVSGSGVMLAIENHCDFTGRQLAPLFARVREAGVGVALDSSNGVTVFSDPNDDIEVLAPFAVTTHCKDMRMVTNPDAKGIPFLPVGCPPGEGIVDFARMVDLLRTSSITRESISLIVEPGWEPVPDGTSADAVRLAIYHDGVSYLRQLVSG